MGKLFDYENFLKKKNTEREEQKRMTSVKEEKFSEEDLKKMVEEKGILEREEETAKKIPEREGPLQTREITDIASKREERNKQVLRDAGIKIGTFDKEKIILQQALLEDAQKYQRLRGFLGDFGIKLIKPSKHAIMIEKFSSEDLVYNYRRSDIEDWKKEPSFYKALFLEILNRLN